MRYVQVILLMLVPTLGGFFSGGCTLMRPAIDAAGDAGYAWWQEKGKQYLDNAITDLKEKAKSEAKELVTDAKDKTIEFVKSTVKDAGNELLASAKSYADNKVVEYDLRLRAAGIDPQRLNTREEKLDAAINYIERQKEKGEPIDWEILLAIVLGGSGATYGAGSLVKGAMRKGKRGGELAELASAVAAHLGKPSAHPPSG